MSPLLESAHPTSGGQSPRVRVGYALGSLATGAFNTVPGLLLLPYLTDTLGIAAGLAGVLVATPKAWDVLVNPVAGRISDRTRSRWGARRPYLLVGGAALAVLFMAIFAGPFGPGTAGATYAALAFLATATAFAFFQVPYVAMPAEMTDSYDERTRLMTWRVAVLAVAILVSGALAPVIVTGTGGAIEGHRWMGVFVGSLILIGALGVFFGTANVPTGRVAIADGSLRTQLRVAARNRPFTRLLSCFLLQSVGIATLLAGVKYFADQILKQPESGPTLIFVCFIGPGILVMPVWSWVGTRLGKLTGFRASSVLMAAGAALLLAAPLLPAAGAYLLVALMGCGFAGQQMFGLAMLPDCIAFDTARTGRRQAGVFTGLWTAGETLGLALGPGVYALVLQLFGYASSATGSAAEQTGTAALGVLLGFTVLPTVLILVPLLLLRGYDLTERRLVEMAATPVN